ncbi:hypothetical protein MAPG_10426 [Magnaporthiopsis poae ATCC 64411]|uniref:Uncharacterized protein n=1 Tax=Magnaporthiopsis poae (strain ATCC 64411 / 73-15) TaxID=644358 RepID=A0A0C4ECJ8_MAGP6|nr:hypothetical protein MAPG_10426 [Magnaporthiopsis poae ATCC 64411]
MTGKQLHVLSLGLVAAAFGRHHHLLKYLLAPPVIRLAAPGPFFSELAPILVIVFERAESRFIIVSVRPPAWPSDKGLRWPEQQHDKRRFAVDCHPLKTPAGSSTEAASVDPGEALPKLAGFGLSSLFSLEDVIIVGLRNAFQRSSLQVEFLTLGVDACPVAPASTCPSNPWSRSKTPRRACPEAAVLPLKSNIIVAFSRTPHAVSNLGFRSGESLSGENGRKARPSLVPLANAVRPATPLECPAVLLDYPQAPRAPALGAHNARNGTDQGGTGAYVFLRHPGPEIGDYGDLKVPSGAYSDADGLALAGRRKVLRMGEDAPGPKPILTRADEPRCSTSLHDPCSNSAVLLPTDATGGGETGDVAEAGGLALQQP